MDARAHSSISECVQLCKLYLDSHIHVHAMTRGTQRLVHKQQTSEHMQSNSNTMPVLLLSAATAILPQSCGACLHVWFWHHMRPPQDALGTAEKFSDGEVTWQMRGVERSKSRVRPDT